MSASPKPRKGDRVLGAAGEPLPRRVDAETKKRKSDDANVKKTNDNEANKKTKATAATAKAASKSKAKAKAKVMEKKENAKVKMKAAPLTTSSGHGTKRSDTEKLSTGTAKRRRGEAGPLVPDSSEDDVDVDVDSPDLAFLAASTVAKDLPAFISSETSLPRRSVAGAVQLFQEGNTLPFIARYRKEATGSMDENSLRLVERSLQRTQTLEKRRRIVATGLLKLGHLAKTQTPLLEATTIEELDDLYAPYKAKRQTRDQKARDCCLEPLANLIESMGGNEKLKTPTEVAARFVGKGVATPEDALAGARDIVAAMHAVSSGMKTAARKLLWSGAQVTVKRKGEADSDGHFKHYWDFQASLDRLRPHQFLAVQRGEREKALKVSFSFAKGVEDAILTSCASWGGSQLWADERWSALLDGLRRLVRPSIEREWRRLLRERAEDEAFDTYRKNLKAKLLAPPLLSRGESGTIIGLDPGFTHGCKVAIVAATGGVLETSVVYPFSRSFSRGGGTETAKAAELALASMIERQAPRVIAIGNGTASSETEELVRNLLKSRGSSTAYSIVDECGASIYSASPLAGAELPTLGVELRGAVSIARRALDPLSELVKIDPQSLGVGLYQRDVDQKRLSLELQGVVEECVSAVGVDVNTASPCLLRYVAGVGPKTSEAIVAHRDAHGAFTNREGLRRVKGMKAHYFQQSAGFLRVVSGDEALDATSVHPESYTLARDLQSRTQGRSLQQIVDEGILDSVAEDLSCGRETLRDIATQLLGSAEDPRDRQPQPLLKRAFGDRSKPSNDGAWDAQELGLTVDMLKVGMRLRGVVRNVVSFGSFVDIGVHNDGLLHVRGYPQPLPRPGWPDVNDRLVVLVETPPEQRGKRWRISLTMRGVGI